VLHNPVQPRPINAITISKDASVLEALVKLNQGTARFRGISPSALNSYIECRLKFYFRYIAGVKEPKLVEDDLDARVLGNFLHEVMEGFYKQIRERKKNKLIEAGDFVSKENAITSQIDLEFIKEYRLDPNRKVTYEGQRLVVKEVVRRFALKILENDEKHAPFVMEAVEQEGLLYNVKISHAPGFVVLGGKIDRVDRKENQIRIIDYKTGKDKLEFDSIESLFERTTTRNKAAFQTLLYALLYRNNAQVDQSFTITPGLINRVNLFDETFQFGLKMKGKLVEDATPLFPEFEARLKELLEEIYDPSKPSIKRCTPKRAGCARIKRSAIADFLLEAY
jgi:ATP-dependent nuclease, subunit B